MAKPLRLNTLGRFFVERDGRRVAGAAAQPRRLALLALLAHAGDQGIRRDRILALLWPDADDERARKGLYQAVYALRQDLGDENAIIGSRELRLDPELVDADVQRFRSALARGELGAAVAEYGGPFLDGFLLASAPEFDRWTDETRTGLARDHASALERLARASAAAGEHVSAVNWWRKLAAQDPFNSRAAVGLMEALVAAGDRPGALQHARIYEVLLQQELDLPPDREVLALAARIREGEPVGAVGAITAVAAVESVPPIQAVPRVAAAVDVPAVPAPQAHHRRLALALAAGALVVVAISLTFRAGAARTPAPRAGAVQRITADAGLEVDPALSPDGKLVAYAAGPENAMQLYVRQLGASGRPVAIGAGVPGPLRRPRWSPDGTRLAFMGARGIYVVPALGGRAELVTEPRDLAAGEAIASYPAWSPDGAQIAYVVWDTLVVHTLTTGTESRLGVVQDGHTIAWSPDGRWIAAASGNSGFHYGDRYGALGAGLGNIAPSAVYLVPTAGGKPVRITDNNALHTSPEWLDASRLMIVTGDGSARDVVVLTIGADGSPQGEPSRLTNGLHVQSVSTWPGTGRVVYTILARTANLWSVALPANGMPARLADARPLTTGSQVIESMDVSPDGQWIAFDSDRSGNQDIYVMPAAGGDAVPLVTGPGDDFRAAWSPDGRELAFYSFERGVRRVFTIPAAGGKPVMLRPGDAFEEHSPDWSPDGRRLVFHRNPDSLRQLFVIERGTDDTWGPARQITRAGCQQGRWSPDGRHVVCTLLGELKVVSLDSGTTRVLLGDGAPDGTRPSYARWSREGSEILFKGVAADGTPSIWAVPADGVTLRLLLRFDDPLRTSPRSEFATDGSRLYFTLTQSESDVWAMALH